MRKTSIALSVAAAFEQPGTALSNLRTVTGADKIGQHDAIVQNCAIIAALYLCGNAPSGKGNPADHAKVAQVFADARMPRYADAMVGLTVALKRKGGRSIADWDDALIEGLSMVDGMIGQLRPAVLTKEQQAAKDAAKAAKAKTREAEAKAAEAEAAEKAKTAAVTLETAAYERGVEAGKAQMPVITAAMVVDLIRAGQFTAADCEAIMQATAVVLNVDLVTEAS